MRAVCEWMGDVLPIASASDESSAKERSKSEGGLESERGNACLYDAWHCLFFLVTGLALAAVST